MLSPHTLCWSPRDQQDGGTGAGQGCVFLTHPTRLCSMLEIPQGSASKWGLPMALGAEAQLEVKAVPPPMAHPLVPSEKPC